MFQSETIQQHNFYAKLDIWSLKLVWVLYFDGIVDMSLEKNDEVDVDSSTYLKRFLLVASEQNIQWDGRVDIKNSRVVLVDFLFQTYFWGKKFAEIYACGSVGISWVYNSNQEAEYTEMRSGIYTTNYPV